MENFPAFSSMKFTSYILDYIKRTRPTIPFKYSLIEEGLFVEEIYRGEKRAYAALLHKIEEDEVKKVIDALNKESKKEHIEKIRPQQLMESEPILRELKHYLHTAEAAKGLLAQLKMENDDINRRIEIAKTQAEDIRAKYRASIENQRPQEVKNKRKSTELCSVLKAQIAEKHEKRIKEREERVRDGQMLKEKLKILDERDRKNAEIARVKETQLLKEISENLRVKEEIMKSQNIKNKNDLLYYLQVENEREAFKKNFVDARNQRLKEREEISAKVGQEIFARNKAKEAAATSLIDYWVNWQENQENINDIQKRQKEIEMRKDLQQFMVLKAKNKKASTQRKVDFRNDLKQQRLTTPCVDSERNILEKTMERERRQNELFLKSLRGKREEKKINEKPDEKAQLMQNEFEVEATRLKMLNEQPISVLRFLPAKLLNNNYLPQPLRDIVREEAIRNPLPVLNQKRYQPHYKRTLEQGGDFIKCCKDCPLQK